MVNMSKPFLSLFYAGLVAALTWTSSASGAAQVDTSQSPFAPLKSVELNAVRWTDGFWAERVGVCAERSIPAMWQLMKSSKYKPFLEHFLIAAGKMEGGHHGAKWNDGDFYKWLEAAIVSLQHYPNPTLEAAIEQSVAAICEAQRADGYIHTPVLIAQRNGDASVKPFQNRHAFEMYNMGHLMTTACIHHRLTGKRDLLEAAEKSAHFLAEAFRDPSPDLARHAICPSHYMGSVELYRTTGNKQYLDLAEHFVDMRSRSTNGGDDNQDRIPLTQHREAIGHAVRANYLYAGVADLYAETGDSKLLEPLTSVWQNLVQKKLYITGGCGALYDGASPDGAIKQGEITRVHQAYGRNYQLPNTTAHNETCANIANVLWCWRMFLISGDAKYIDVLERTLYNSVLSGVSLNGTEYFYVNPLRVIDPLPTELRYPRTRQPFFTSFCCPPNLVRTIIEIIGLAYSKTEDAMWVNLYGSNVFSTELNGQNIKLEQKTEYPWKGDIQIELLECSGDEFALRLRVPDWADQMTASLNGAAIESLETKLGYLEIRRKWRAGDTLKLHLPMPVKLLRSNPSVEENTNQVAVQRGPIVYCLESVDLPEDVGLNQVIIPKDIQFTSQFEPDFLHGVVVLEGTAKAESETDWDTSLYREMELKPLRDFRLRLIPYYAWANRGATEMSVWLPVR